jgi:hypothetical protein
MVLYPRRLSSSYSPPREPEISQSTTDLKIISQCRRKNIPPFLTASIYKLSSLYTYELNMGKLIKHEELQYTFTSMSPILLTARMMGRPTMDGKM